MPGKAEIRGLPYRRSRAALQSATAVDHKRTIFIALGSRLCAVWPSVCMPRQVAIYRSRADGSWQTFGFALDERVPITESSKHLYTHTALEAGEDIAFAARFIAKRETADETSIISDPDLRDVFFVFSWRRLHGDAHLLKQCPAPENRFAAMHDGQSVDIHQAMRDAARASAQGRRWLMILRSRYGKAFDRALVRWSGWSLGWAKRRT